MHRSVLMVMLVVLVMAVSACAGPAAGSDEAATPGAAQSSLATPGSSESPVAGGASTELQPTLANAAAEWLAAQAGVSAADLKVVQAERVDFSDACLGLGGPAESCAQVITPGWRITFEANGQQYEVHSDDLGGVFRLATSLDK